MTQRGADITAVGTDALPAAYLRAAPIGRFPSEGSAVGRMRSRSMYPASYLDTVPRLSTMEPTVGNLRRTR